MVDLTREQQIRMWHRPAPHWPADCWCEECRPDSWRNGRGRELEAEIDRLRAALAASEAARDEGLVFVTEVREALGDDYGGEEANWRARSLASITRLRSSLRAAEAERDRCAAEVTAVRDRISDRLRAAEERAEAAERWLAGVREDFRLYAINAERRAKGLKEAVWHLLSYHGHSNEDTDCPACSGAFAALARPRSEETPTRPEETPTSPATPTEET